jgi:uncharacterized protein YqeY
MKNVTDHIRKSIVKRQDALDRFQQRKRDFLQAREAITKEIEEARTIWETALKNMPNLPFS